jgi:hypothetical protein
MMVTPSSAKHYGFADIRHTKLEETDTAHIRREASKSSRPQTPCNFYLWHRWRSQNAHGLPTLLVQKCYC